MQEGGVVQPQVNQQNVVPGVKFTAPKQQTLRPSVYTQPAMQPAVQKAPTVNVPTQPTYTAQVLNQQPQKTNICLFAEISSTGAKECTSCRSRKTLNYKCF